VFCSNRFRINSYRKTISSAKCDEVTAFSEQKQLRRSLPHQPANDADGDPFLKHPPENLQDHDTQGSAAGPGAGDSAPSLQASAASGP
jgi:hypothetical protein